MTTLDFAPTACLPAGHAVRREARIERALADYVERYQQRVRQVAGEDGRLADLAVSFPGLLFVLAVPRQGVDVRALKEGVLNGLPLKELARRAGIPIWVRKLRPAAFDAPLGPLPSDPMIAKLICNHLPRARAEAGVWLRAVSAATRWGTDAFAVWVARLSHGDRLKLKERDIQLLALWAWYSVHRGDVPVDLIVKPWNMEMKLKPAVGEANDWLERVELHVLLREAVRKPRFRPGRWEGCDFVHLADDRMIAEEADRMKNCVRSYARNIEENGDELWSVRRGGVSLATVNVGLHYDDNLPYLIEIKGPRNERVAPDIALTVRRWLMSHDVQAISWPVETLDRGRILARWRTLFKPYWLAKGARPSLLPLSPKNLYFGYICLRRRYRLPRRRRR